MRKRNEQCKTRHAGVVYARRICLRAIAHHRALLPRPAHIQKPQNQPDRDDDRRARQDVIGNLADGTKAHRPDSVGEIFDRAVDIPRPDIEPHEKGAGDQRYEQKAQEDRSRRAAEETDKGRLSRRRARLPPVSPGRRSFRDFLVFTHEVFRLSDRSVFFNSAQLDHLDC